MKMLRISDDISLPLDTATQTIAILARKRVGKTYTASVIAEELIKASIPIVVLDPTGAWWGLRSSADGKHEGFPVVIIGGEHADVPLEDMAGKIIADLVVDHPGYYVIDLSKFEHDSQIRRFATDFGKRFYFRKEQKRFPMQLIVDEADIVMPQKPRSDETVMLHTYDNIVRRGGLRGIGMTLICQRPAVLNKNVLTQCETLIQLQMTGSQDVDAVEHWTRIHGTDAERKELLSSIATLQRGEAWIWSPSWLQVFKRVHIRERETFNSSATPKAGEKVVVPQKLAAVDIVELGEQIKLTVERAKANDPEILKRQVADLQKQLRAAESKAPVAAQPLPPEKIHVVSESDLVEVSEAAKLFEAMIATDRDRTNAARELAASLQNIHAALLHIKQPQVRITKATGLVADAIRTAPRLAASQRHNPKSFSVESNGNEPLPKGERKILTACAQFEAVEKGDLITLTGFKRATRDAYIARLREKGFVDDSNGSVRPTDEGLAALGSWEPLPTGDALKDYWLNKLPSGEVRILRLLLEVYPKFIRRDELDEPTDFKRATRDAYLARMKPKRIIELGHGTVRASPMLFD